MDLRERYEVDEKGCWIWQGQRYPDGYGKWCGRTAHRTVFLKLGGVIPAGLELDHLCLTPLCVNPMHLEPVTREENMRRRYALITKCVNGHNYDAENTYHRPNGRRDCRACIRERVRRYKRRKSRRAA